jgi:hypothetical protein
MHVDVPHAIVVFVLLFIQLLHLIAEVYVFSVGNLFLDIVDRVHKTVHDSGLWPPVKYVCSFGFLLFSSEFVFSDILFFKWEVRG